MVRHGPSRDSPLLKEKNDDSGESVVKSPETRMRTQIGSSWLKGHKIVASKIHVEIYNEYRLVFRVKPSWC